MIKRLLVSLPIALLGALPVSASVSLDVNAGLLTSHTGADLTDGDLILLIASTSSGTFGAAPAGGFVSGDNIIVGTPTAVTGAFAMNDGASGTTGETYNTLMFNYGSGSVNNSTSTALTFDAGDKLAIRWYDDFTLAQFEAGQTPTQGDYGTYTISGTTSPDGGLAWVGPADGSVLTGGEPDAQGLNFFTMSDTSSGSPGSQPNSFGMANTPVLAEVVPEPSTFALFGVGFLLYAGSVLRKRLACKSEK